MIRIVAENILLFLLPTIIYVAYVYLTREEKPEALRVLDDAPLVWLFFAGAAVVLITLLTFGSVTGGKPGQVYTPPSFKDGKIQPGHIE
jgi:RsiW-degrading membrane proteinase PrsW (M82 family)